MIDAEEAGTRTDVTANSKKMRKKEKEELQNKTNHENMAAAIALLENITQNHYKEVNRDIKSRIGELVSLLKDKDPNSSLSVRAANAVSMLDRLTQDKGMKSHIRTMLWKVVSNLESIRE
jgi:uncharacterized protein